MTTITFKRELHLKKKTFNDIFDFYQYLLKNNLIVEFRELDKDEITDELIELKNKTLNKDKSRFINI